MNGNVHFIMGYTDFTNVFSVTVHTLIGIGETNKQTNKPRESSVINVVLRKASKWYSFRFEYR